MAEAKAAAAGGKKAKKSGKMGTIMLTMLMCLAMPFMLPSLFLLMAGLVPTYVALCTDDDPEKSGAVSVGAMNLAGISPFMIDLWLKGQTMGNVFHIMADPDTWVVILGAAAVGQLIVYAIPQAIATLTMAQAETRIRILRKNLERLKEAWGPEVATTKPVDSIIQG